MQCDINAGLNKIKGIKELERQAKEVKKPKKRILTTEQQAQKANDTAIVDDARGGTHLSGLSRGRLSELLEMKKKKS